MVHDFLLAILSVHGSYKSATAVLLFVPLFALAIPLVIQAERITRDRRPDLWARYRATAKQART